MEKIKILYLAADPRSNKKNKSPSLHLDKEFREINQVIQLSKYRDKIELSSDWAVRINDIYVHVSKLIQFRLRGYYEGMGYSLETRI